MRYTDQLLEAVPAVFEHFLEQLQAELATSTGTVRDTGGRAIQVRTGSTGTNQATTSPGALLGFSLAESTGGAGASLVLRDGTDSSADPLVYVNLLAGESTRDWYGDEGIGFGRGVFVHVITGAIEGAVYLRGPS